MSNTRKTCLFLFGLLLVFLGLPSCSSPETSGETKDPYEAREALMKTEVVDASIFKSKADQAAGAEAALKFANLDLSQTTIQYFSSSAPSGDLTYPKEKTALEVLDYGPEGELPIEVSKPIIYASFNHPMVPLAKLGEPLESIPYFKIDPPLEGVYRWYGTKTVSFQPKASLLDAPKYTISLTKDARSLGGTNLETEKTFTFYTEAVKIVNFYPGKTVETYPSTYEVPLDLARYIILEFNQEVEPKHIQEFLEVTFDDSASTFSLGRPDYPEELKSRTKRALLLDLGRSPPENTTIELVLKDGASPKADYPQRSGEQSFSMRTISPFRLRSLEASAWSFPANNLPSAIPVYAEFSHSLKKPLKNEDLTIRINSKPVQAESLDTFGNTVRLNLNDLKAGDTVDVQAKNSIEDEYSRHLNNINERFTLTMPEASAYINYPGWGFNHLEAAFAPKVLWESRNLQSASFGLETRPDYATDWLKNYKTSLKPLDLADWLPNKVHYELEDLAPFLNSEGKGTVLMNWKAQYQAYERTQNSTNTLAVQVTDLGITSRYAYNRVLVWVNSLSSGKSVSDAQVSLGYGKAARIQKTDASGLAVFSLEPGTLKDLSLKPNSESLYIKVTKGQDSAELPSYNSQDSWGNGIMGHNSPFRAELPSNKVLLFTDRGLYKPGEELAFRGIHWIQQEGLYSPYLGDFKISLQVPNSNKALWEYKAKTSESGGFAQRLRLPSNLEPGSYYLKYEANNFTSYESFSIAEFRRLAFQLTNEVPEQDFYLGDEVSANIKAQYLAGGALPGAQVSWYWSRQAQDYSPPGQEWNNWVFGPGSWEGDKTLSASEGKLSSSGEIRLSEKTDGQNADGSAYRYTVEASVQDIDRQVIASTARILVHPADFYVGARFISGSSDGWWSRFVSVKSDVGVEAALVDPSGQVFQDDRKITARILQGTWKSTQQQGVYGRLSTRWDYSEEEIQKTILDVKKGKVQWKFQVPEAGNYLLSLEAQDAKGRLSKTVLRFYASGSTWVRQASESPSSINLIVDKPVYKAGETARILVQSSIAEGDYLLSIEREGIYEEKILHLKGSQNLIEVPVKEEYVPVFYVALSSFTKREEAPSDYFEPDLGKPRSLFGIAGVSVSTESREIQIDIKKSKSNYKPGERAELELSVFKNGRPLANTELSVLAVDRGVLDLIDYHVPNALEYFYAPWNYPLGVYGDDSRRLLLKPVTYDVKSLAGGDDDKTKERSDFRPLALFEPFIKTDAQGKAKVSFTLPDSLTTYRVSALAVNGTALGSEESEILVQNPINMRTALPRRLRNRDTSVAGVILSNLTDEKQSLTISLESDLLEIAGEKEKTVSIAPKGVLEVPFILVAKTPGTANLVFTARGSGLNERLKDSLLVERPLVTETFSTLGFIENDDKTSFEGLLIPSRIAPGYGNLRLEAGSSFKTFVAPSLERLLEKPEIWWSYNRKLFRAFALVWENTGRSDVESLLKDLKNRQREDGGIYTGSWTFAPYMSNEYTSLLCAHFMLFAENLGQNYRESPDREKLLKYLNGLKSKDPQDDAWFQAYLAYVLCSARRFDISHLDQTAARADALGLGGYGLLSQAYLMANRSDKAKDLYKRSKNFVSIGTRSVDLKESYEVKSYWSSQVMELALLLTNAQSFNEDKHFILLLANSLKTKKQWQNLADDLWTVLAFIPLLQDEKPDQLQGNLTLLNEGKTLAKLDLNSEEAKTQLDFDKAPLKDLPRDTVLALEFQKSNSGRAFYTGELNYALPSETAFARSEGLEVYTQWEDLDGNKIKTNELVLGKTYRIRCTVSSDKRRQDLELQVPIPSGAEIIDSSFVSNGRFANQGGLQGESWTRETVYGDEESYDAEGSADYNGFNWTWYYYLPETFALDSSMVYRWSDFYAGSREVSFLVRLTSPGIYPTPPSKASLEFEPEVFGRSDGQLFIVKP